MTLKHAFLSVMTLGLFAFGCNVDHTGVDDTGYYFTGAVYNGVDGNPVSEFKITLTQASGTVTKSVKKSTNGMFEIGPVKPGSDYVIKIDADNFRPFFDAEAMKAALPNNPEKTTTQYFEAYLFPKDVKSPAVTFDIFGADSANTRPSGKIRFAPQGDGTSALNLGGTMTPAVTGQIWPNDADRKAGTVMRDLTDGVVNVDEDSLVYGVAYQATVFAVDGHAYQNFTFTAGLSGHQTVTLKDLAVGTDLLAVESSSLDNGTYSENGTVKYTFNYPIEYAAATPEGYCKEVLDDNISILTVNTNGNTTYNVLKVADDANVQERNTSISIDGKTLTISWPGYNNSASYEPNSYDLEDLQAVTYDLRLIKFRPVGSLDEKARALSDLVGNSVTVQLKQPSH